MKLGREVGVRPDNSPSLPGTARSRTVAEPHFSCRRVNELVKKSMGPIQTLSGEELAVDL